MSNTDTKRLSFTLDDVIRFAVITLTVAGAFWMTTSGLRSDVRDILTQQTMQGRLYDSSMKLQDERLANLKNTVDAMTRRQELQQYEIQQLKEMMLKAGIVK